MAYTAGMRFPSQLCQSYGVQQKSVNNNQEIKQRSPSSIWQSFSLNPHWHRLHNPVTTRNTNESTPPSCSIPEAHIMIQANIRAQNSFNLGQ